MFLLEAIMWQIHNHLTEQNNCRHYVKHGIVFNSSFTVEEWSTWNLKLVLETNDNSYVWTVMMMHHILDFYDHYMTFTLVCTLQTILVMNVANNQLGGGILLLLLEQVVHMVITMVMSVFHLVWQFTKTLSLSWQRNSPLGELPIRKTDHVEL